MFQDLNPLDKTTAVLEIVIMLLVAFLLGILTMWLARKKKKEEPINNNEDKIENANAKIEELSSNVSSMENENKQLKQQIEELQFDVSKKRGEKTAQLEELEKQINDFKLENKKLTDALYEQEKQNHELNQLVKEQKTSAGQDILLYENKINSLKEQLASTEKELHEQEKLNYELNHKLKRPAPKFSSKEEAAEALGFKLAKEEDKEDLTIIKGIGPFIQEKLNELGIYTIEQISDFTIDTVIKVTEAIEYFPGRIQRDFWVEQANQILNDRVQES